MPRAKRSIGGKITLDGHELEWRLHREQQNFGDGGWVGVAIEVRAIDGRHRELYLEYPVAGLEKLSLARAEIMQPQIQTAKVVEHIKQAMEAGWDPASRGRPFVYEVGELPHN